MKQQNRDYDVEWGYAFDVHLNAFYPLLVILHFIQLFFINCKLNPLSSLLQNGALSKQLRAIISCRCHHIGFCHWVFCWEYIMADCNWLLHLCDVSRIQW